MLTSAAALLLAALGASTLDDVQLRWKPTDEPGDVANLALRQFRTSKVQVKPFTDTRPDKALVGQNTEGAVPRNVTTRDDVGAFCATQLEALLRQAGVPAGDGAGLVISGNVLRFMVNEGNVYRGTVALELTVSHRGKKLWSGVVTGEAKRWGRSYKYENYMEALSDSLMRTAEELFKDPKLAAALEGVS